MFGAELSDRASVTGDEIQGKENAIASRRPFAWEGAFRKTDRPLVIAAGNTALWKNLQ